MTTPADSGAGQGHGVSEAASFVASMLPALPEQTTRDLRRLLARKLTLPSPAEVRYQRLGLLMDLLAASHGEVPTVAAYSDAREARTKDGQSGDGGGWASASTLIEAYGSWTRAVRTAMWLHRDGSASQTPASVRPHPGRRAYSHDEALAGVRLCRDAIGGAWPTESEYDDYRLLARELAGEAGQAFDRCPTRGTLARLFGPWAATLEAAATRKRAELPSSDEKSKE